MFETLGETAVRLRFNPMRNPPGGLDWIPISDPLLIANHPRRKIRFFSRGANPMKDLLALERAG